MKNNAKAIRNTVDQPTQWGAPIDPRLANLKEIS